MFFKKIALLSLLLSSLTLASDLPEGHLDLESGRSAVAVLHAGGQDTVDLQASDDSVLLVEPSHERSYLTPVDTSKNIVVRLPPKATYFHQLALDALHAEGLEYPVDHVTVADCLASGALFKRMFPSLYDTSSTPIMYIIPAHLSPENAQHVFGSNLSDGVKSTKDKPMEILERNAIIKGMHTQKTPLTGGKMIMPVSDKLGVVYRCAEGSSYPETGTIVSSNQGVGPSAITNDGIIAATLQ